MTHYELAEKSGAKITSTTNDNGTGLWATFHTFEFSDIELMHLISLVEQATLEKAAKLVENASSYQSWQIAAAIRSMK